MSDKERKEELMLIAVFYLAGMCQWMKYVQGWHLIKMYKSFGTEQPLDTVQNHMVLFVFILQDIAQKNLMKQQSGWIDQHLLVSVYHAAQIV